MYMTFECDPEKANELKPLLYKEVDNIIREGGYGRRAQQSGQEHAERG